MRYSTSFEMHQYLHQFNIWLKKYGQNLMGFYFFNVYKVGDLKNSIFVHFFWKFNYKIF